MLTTEKTNKFSKWTIAALTAVLAAGTMVSAVQVKAASQSPAAVQSKAETGSAYIKKIYGLAKQGKVPGAPWISGKSTLTSIHKFWGKPTTGSGTGAHYENYNFGMGAGAYAIGVNSKGTLYDLRDLGQSIDTSVGIKSLTFTSVIATLGMPKEVRFTGNDKIYVYTAGAYQLKFVGPSSVVKGHVAHIDHINVYSPQAAK
ncbi:YjgB family protein [Paenibacillus gansuensis]|uniref:YjgB family protein n=1 Tax=Paenibacillus gansuensis TaxID=306542 RepID=A0ABW5PEN3_9BACL